MICYCSNETSAHPTERADLFGKRLVACVETGDGLKLNEALVKETTGVDTIRARRMREDFWQFRPTHKVLICTNHKPRIRGTDHAIWRSIRLILFEMKFEGDGEDKKLSEKLKNEAEGILAWAVLGCRQWLAEGLGDPDSVKLATFDYRTGEDRLTGFIAERCVIDNTSETRAGELFQAYTAFCEIAGEEPMTLTSFGKALEERGFPKRKGRFVMRQGIALTQ